MAKGIVRKIKIALDNVHEEIVRSTDRSNQYSKGLAYEGYNGGYLAALNDVLLALNGVTPQRNGWGESHLTERAADLWGSAAAMRSARNGVVSKTGYPSKSTSR